MQINNEFKPKIVAFCCNWCSYASADLAGNNRLAYPECVNIIRVLKSQMVILSGVLQKKICQENMILYMHILKKLWK